MENSLVMKTDSAFGLNFLIYIQNIYLNQNRNDEELKFPYIETRMAFRADFETKYKDVWNKVSDVVFRDEDHHIRELYEEKDLYYEELFENNPDSLMIFNEVYKTFQVWWGSIAGKFSMERAIDEKGQSLYIDLANLLNQREITPQKELHISLIYDDCLLADAAVADSFAILSIRDFIVHNKVLVQKIFGGFQLG